MSKNNKVNKSYQAYKDSLRLGAKSSSKYREEMPRRMRNNFLGGLYITITGKEPGPLIIIISAIFYIALIIFQN